MDIRGFQLTRVPDDFFDDPYPYYAALRELDPAHELEGGAVFLSRYDDLVTVYRSPCASSDKKLEFAPKFGASPLYEHHTTSLVFNDPPLHTRVRGLIMGALNQRAIARMEADVVSLVDRLLDQIEGESDFIEDFAAGRCAPGRSPSSLASSPGPRPRCSSAAIARCSSSGTISSVWSRRAAERPETTRATC